MTTVRPTLRLRLTLLFGGLLLLAGAGLLSLAYVLVRRSLEAGEVPQLVRVRNQFGQEFTVRVPGGDVIQAVQQQLNRDALDTLVSQSLPALLIIGLVGVVLAWFLAGRALRPLQHITTTAQRLSTETLDSRLSLQGPDDELKQLGDTFDAMLERLSAAFESQRRFVANASHELRTPLAVMRTEVDVTLGDPDASVADLRAMGEVVRDATERADRLVDALLLLARSDRGLDVRRRVDLGSLVAEEVDQRAAAAAARRITVEVATGPAAVLGDADLLRRLVGNLVENAITHNVDGGRVWVATEVAHGQVLLRVASTGEEVDPATVAGLFDPFRRGERARAARLGYGLGLSIVRSVAAAHGGTVTASARPGGGLDLAVELPPCP